MSNKITPATHPDLGIAPFPCLVCGRVLCNVHPSSENQPYDAAAFSSGGHYGCGVFDEWDGSRLEINVCDDCLTAARERGHIGYLPGHPKRTLVPWTEDH